MFNGVAKKANIMTTSFIVVLLVIAVILRYSGGDKPAEKNMYNQNQVEQEQSQSEGQAKSPNQDSSQNKIQDQNQNTNQKPMKENPKITIETNKGSIMLELYASDAPKTVENFVTLANKGFYNGVIFHRVIKGFMIQGGDPTGTGRGGPGYQFADELNSATDSYKTGYKRGVVAMANAGPNTNGSQFFIMHQDYPLPNNYTIFGHVIGGQDIVDAIADTATNDADRPLSDVVMKSVKVNQ